jgi:hypothetical protein
MATASFCGVFGVAHSSPSQVHTTLENALGSSHVQLVRSGDALARRRAYVVVGVSTLRKLSEQLGRTRATVVVLDAVPQLCRISGVKIIDADDAAPHSARWLPPSKTDYRPLLRHAQLSKPALVTILFTKVDVATNLIKDVKSRGILDKVLTLSYKCSKDERSFVLDTIFAFLCGKGRISRLEKRLRLGAESSVRQVAYEALVASLNSPYGKRLAKAVTAVHPSFDKEACAKAAVRYRVDVFEMNYIGAYLTSRPAASRRARLKKRS